MESTIYTTSEKGNNYYMDFNKRIVGYTHPILSWVFSYEKQNGIFDNIPDSINIENVGEVTKNTIQYYIKKYKFFKLHGLNSNRKVAEKFSGCISPSMIEYEIANLVQLTFEVTDGCNLNCKYCGYGDLYFDYDPRKNNVLSFDVAKRMIAFVVGKWNSPLNSSYKGLSFISFYGGEPLLCVPLIEKIIKYVNSLEKNREIFFSMTTNGVLIDKYEDFLVKNKIKLTISLDGNENNNGYRIDYSGKSSFNKVFSNTKHLKEKYPEYYRNNVSFNSVLHNKNSVEEIHYFLKKEFEKPARITELNNSGIRKGKTDKFKQMFKNYRADLKQSKHYKKIVNELFINTPDIRALSLFIKQHSGFFFSSYSELFIDQEKKIKLPTGTCLPFGKKMFVTVNGKILPCERIGHQFGLGLATSDSVNLNTKIISEKYNSYFSKLRNKCDNCYKNHSCIQCVFNMDDIDKLQPKCNGYSNYEKFSNYFSTIISYLEEHPNLYTDIIKNVILE